MQLFRHAATAALPIPPHGRQCLYSALLAMLFIAVLPAFGRENRVAGSVAPTLEAQDEPSQHTLLDHTAGVGFRIDLPAAAVPPATSKGARGPMRIGFHRDVPEASQGDLLPLLDWRPLGDGAVAAALWISSPEATSIRVGVRAHLAEGAEVRFFHPGGRGESQAITQADFHFPRDKPDGRVGNGQEAGRSGGQEGRITSEPEILWSPSVDGDVVGIEIMLPSLTAAGVSWFRVEKIAHRFFDPGSTRHKALGCPDLHVDVQCRVGEFPARLENAVARIDFEAGGASRLCTGTLLHTFPPTFMPYFLTANHCVATAEVARTVQTTWFYQHRRCGFEALDAREETVAGGAELLATSARQDSTLLRIRGRLPVRVSFAGWDTAPVLRGDAVVGIHHPDGEVKKYSAGTVLGKEDYDDASVIELTWDEGVTEGGSSGSALFRDGLVIGALIGGEDCSASAPQDYYGSFADFFPHVCSMLDPYGSCDDHGDSPSTATDVSVPGSASGRINPGDDEDYFRFDLSRSGTVVVLTSGNLDTVGTLYDSGGRRLQEDDDSGVDGNFRIVRTLGAGVYYVHVRSYAGTTGQYRLHLSVEEASSRRGVGYRRSLGDFNGDGKDDVLLRHTNGRWHYYPMDGRTVLPGAGSASLTENTTVSVAGVGDLNGDGKDDMLMRRANGTWYYYPMNGRRSLAGRGEVRLTNNLAWFVAGIGDFNGDGKDDVLLRHANGHWYYYPMDGRTVLGGAGSASLTGDPTVWVAGVGDLNGDGKDDVLMRRANGTWYYYPMNGRRSLAGRGGARLTGSLAWSMAGIGDFNGDGKDDVLLRHANGRWHYYPMDGRTVLPGAGSASLTENTTVSVAGVGDLNGDGKDDVLMRRANGTWYYYPMNGRRSLAGRGGARLTGSLAWSMAGIGDFNGDGKDDALLRHANGRWHYYPMDGRAVLPGAGSASLTENTTVSVAGIGDLNGDGKDDVLMRRANGTWYYYPMNGRRSLAGRGEVRLTGNLAWSMAGIGDFNGDGKDDVLLRHANGRWHYYPMDGRAVLPGAGSASLTENATVSVAGIGDLNGDGRDDVLMRRANGTWYYYPMNGRRSLAGRGEVRLSSNLAWSVAGIEDFNGDGKDDVLLRHTNGHWYYYPMDGRTVLSGAGSASLTGNPTVSVVGVGDLNGDGKDDVLMRRANGTWYYYPMNGRRSLWGRGEARLTANSSWGTLFR